MEKEIELKTKQLIDAIKASDLYIQYETSCRALDGYPGVFDRLMELRMKTIALYENATEEELLEGSDALAEQYEELQKIPEVNAFLESEEELAHTLRKISAVVLKAVNMRLPNPQ